MARCVPGQDLLLASLIGGRLGDLAHLDGRLCYFLPMPLPYLVHVHAEREGGWRISAGLVGMPLATGHLGPEELAALRAEIAQALDPESGPVMLVAGLDAWQTRAEEQAGRALSRVLHASPELSKAFAHARGVAEGSRDSLAVVIDPRQAGAGDLPWELLAGSAELPPLEGEGHMVVRLEVGLVGSSAKASLRPVFWAPDLADPQVGHLLAAIGTACSTWNLAAPVAVEELAMAAHEEALLFVVVHGEAGEVELDLLLPDGGVSPGGMVGCLVPTIQRAALVVLLVCEGGYRPERPSDSLVCRVLSAGARACVASEVRLGVDAGEAFVDGLCRGLSEDKSLAQAVAQGRRAVRGLYLPFSESRWWRFALTVGGADVVQWRPRPGLPAGWHPGPQAAELLDRALARAVKSDGGWLGIEHVALALDLDSAELPASVRRLLVTSRAELRGHLAGFKRKVDGAGPPRPSPRLDRVVRQLPAGFGIGDLVEALLRELPRRFAEHLELSEGHPCLPGETQTDNFTLMLDRQALGGAWDAFEQVGGPEDGRRFGIHAGEVVGRWANDDGVALPLYADSLAEDGRLSRRHLRGLGQGRVALLRKAHGALCAAGWELFEGAELRLECGDLIGLTRATWLLAVRSASLE